MKLLQSLFGPPLPALSAAELSEKLKSSKRPLVVDVRQPDEFRAGHISGSRLVPLGELSRRLKELPNKTQEIVLVCASGSRSRSATKLLAGAGYNAFNMTGGLAAWARAGLPLKKG